jgi:hypothetical protein
MSWFALSRRPELEVQNDSDRGEGNTSTSARLRASRLVDSRVFSYERTHRVFIRVRRTTALAAPRQASLA